MARLPKSIIKKYGITKKAWSVFRGRKRKSPSRTRKASPSRRKGGRKTMARRKKRRGGGKSLAQQAMKWIRIGALVGPGAIQIATRPTIEEKLGWCMKMYTGVDPWTGQFEWRDLAAGWTPYLAAVATTYGIPKLASIIRRL